MANHRRNAWNVADSQGTRSGVSTYPEKVVLGVVGGGGNARQGAKHRGKHRESLGDKLMAYPSITTLVFTCGVFLAGVGAVDLMTVSVPQTIPDRFTGTDGIELKAQLMEVIAENSRLIAENGGNVAANKALIIDLIKEVEAQNRSMRNGGEQ